jgi:hypothetical protein
MTPIQFAAGFITRIPIRSPKLPRGQVGQLDETTMKKLRHIVAAGQKKFKHSEVTIKQIRYQDGMRVGLVDTTIDNRQ